MKGYIHNMLTAAVMITLWLIPTLSMQAQQATITGSVTDPSASPLAGASITVVEDPNIQVVTDTNGLFAISAEPGQHLKVTTEEGLSKKVTIHQQESINITVGRDIQLGYGIIQSPAGLTAAVSTAEASDLAKNSMAINPENTLYGRLPGLTVLENSGLPPTSPTLFIRGRGTFTDPAPLVLVDGFERPLSSLSTDEIEQITVLKDAAALAKYGQRGANGIVLVTTKRGGTDGLEVTTSYDVAFTQPTALPNLLEAPAYARALNEARINDGRELLYSSADLQAFEEGTSPYLFPNVNWFDEVLREQGMRHKLNTRFRGGGDRARYFASLGYIGDSGLYGPVDSNEGYSSQLRHQRLNFRSNLDIDLTDNLLFQVDLSGTLTDNNHPGQGGIFTAMYTVPSAAFPVKVPDGRWGGTPVYDNNPVAMLTARGYRKPNAREFSLTGRLQRDLRGLVEGLSAEVVFSHNVYGQFNEQEIQSYSYASVTPVRDDEGTIIDQTVTGYGVNTDLDWSRSFVNKRQYTDMLGQLRYDRTLEDYTIKMSTQFHQLNRVFPGRNNTFRHQNFMGNVHMGWLGKYFFDVTLSYSGNNYLPEENRFGFFPAISGGWLLSEEGFLEDVSFVDRLKVRASWGMSGSDRLPNNKANEPAQVYDSGPNYRFHDSNSNFSGFEEIRLGSYDFTHETSYQTNLGVEVTLFGSLDVTTDLFYDRRTDILTGTGGYVSDVLGVTPPQVSEGVVDNRGVEVAMQWEGAIGKVAYYLGGQFSMARNEIVEMNEQFRPYPYLQRTGQPVGQPFGLEAIGFFQDQADIDSSPQQVFSEVRPGDIKYQDQNGDGVINEFDEVPQGYASDYPEMYFSTNLGFQYKGLGVSALLQGTAHQTVYLNTPSVFRPLGDGNNSISTWYYDRRWTPQTAGTATLPRLTTESNANNFRANDIWRVDGSYIKLRTLEISYSLPMSWTRQWKMDNVQLYLRGMNLFSIDDVPELDPENMGTGYPLLRSYSAGIEIQF